MKVWYLHDHYKANGLGTNKKSYNIFDLRHLSKVSAHFQKKSNIFICSFKHPSEEIENIEK